MPKIFGLTVLRVEDFPSEQRPWLPRLLTPLNQFLTSTSNAINGALEFGPNIPALDATLEFNYGGVAQSFTWNVWRTGPKVLWVGQATEDGESIVLLPQWSYDSSTGKITVDFKKLTGSALSIGSKYIIFIRAVP